MTGYVGCVIWVRHGLDCNRLIEAEILLCLYQAGRLKYSPRKVSLRRSRISWLNQLILITISPWNGMWYSFCALPGVRPPSRCPLCGTFLTLVN
jgi:hypothetical protein